MLVSRVPLTDTQISNYANGSDSLSGTILSNDPSNGNVKMLTVQNSGDYYVTLVATTSSSGSYSFNPATFPSETVLTSTAAAVSNAYPNYYVYTGDGNPTTFTLTGLTDPTKHLFFLHILLLLPLMQVNGDQLEMRVIFRFLLKQMVVMLRIIRICMLQLYLQLDIPQMRPIH